MRIRDLLVLAPIAALFVACASPTVAETQEGDDTSEGDGTDPAPAGDKTKSDTKAPAPAGASAKCPYDGPPLDVSAFATCRDGGRCIPDKAFPPEQAAQKARLAPCDGGGFCVPEKIIKAQGNALPKSCKSFASLEGRCTSTVFPDIEKQKDRLPQDACDANERCAPCFDPSGKATGACSSVSCDAPKEPFKPFQACCSSGGKSRGKCLPSASLPAEAATGLEKKECSAAADLCVPEEQLDEKFVNPKCTASSLLGQYDGVCISTCVKMDFLTQLGTAQGSCSAESFCAPCKNPLTGAATGAPGCAP
ncbi:MAG: Tryptophan synthase alpha chain [Labilithrix sp.]|jgi:hypothetical protein|nr:Tryptophan synthase alpha chain [Labilithrix sp.]